MKYERDYYKETRPSTSSNVVYAVRPSGSPKCLRYFANTQSVIRNCVEEIKNEV